MTSTFVLLWGTEKWQLLDMCCGLSGQMCCVFGRFWAMLRSGFWMGMIHPHPPNDEMMTLWCLRIFQSNPVQKEPKLLWFHVGLSRSKKTESGDSQTCKGNNRSGVKSPEVCRTSPQQTLSHRLLGSFQGWNSLKNFRSIGVEKVSLCIFTYLDPPKVSNSGARVCFWWLRVPNFRPLEDSGMIWIFPNMQFFLNHLHWKGTFWHWWILWWKEQRWQMRFTLPKTNMDTQNDGLEKLTPFTNGNFWYCIYVRFLWCILFVKFHNFPENGWGFGIQRLFLPQVMCFF